MRLSSCKGALIVVLLFSLAGVCLAVKPGFDCQKAQTPIEKLICGSDVLSNQDRQMNQLYESLLNQAAEKDRGLIRAEQRNFLKQRDKLCNLDPTPAEKCLREIYQERITALKSQFAHDSTDSPTAGALMLLRITPEGDDVQPGQQIVFQFDRPVVPIGRMERKASEIPIKIQPACNCEWRWLNTSALACQLRQEDALKPATKYTVKVRPGIKDETGATLAKDETHTFITQRPKITYTRFVYWLTPGTPLIQVTFNQPVTKASLEKSLRLKNSESERDATTPILAYPDELLRQLPGLTRYGFDYEQRVDDRKMTVGNDEARRVWIIKPFRELPLDTNVELWVAPGLVSGWGPERGVEDRLVVEFDTYPAFRFVGLRGVIKGETDYQNFSLEELTENAAKDNPLRLSPLRPVALIFSAPVLNSQVKDQVRFSPGLDGGHKDYDPWENRPDQTRLDNPHRKDREYAVWLPELLKAFETYKVEITKACTDEFGRHLDKKLAFRFFTGHREPDLRLSHQVAILEKDVDSDVPLFVTNLEEVNVSYDRLSLKKNDQNLTHTIAVPSVLDVSFALPLGVRSLLGDESGVVYTRLHPDPEPPDWPPHWPNEPHVLAQVTPFAVHAKMGHFNSLVWVTDFATGKPVESAKISLFKGWYGDITRLENMNVTAKTDLHGRAVLPGLTTLDPSLRFIDGGRYSNQSPGMFVRVEKERDMALLPLSSDFRLSGQEWPHLRQPRGHTYAWGTTAQGVYKPGDKIEFKIYLRDQTNRHWVRPKEDEYTLTVTDPQGKTVFEQKEVSLNAFGATDGAFTVPEQATTGWYQFSLKPAKKTGSDRTNLIWRPMEVLVSDFTPSPFKVTAELSGKRFQSGDRVKATALATLHSGGPFTRAQARLTARLNPSSFHSDHPSAKGFVFSASSNPGLDELLNVQGNLDAAGQYQEGFVIPDTKIYYGHIMLEAAVKDDRGKYVAATAQADYAGRDRFVGLRRTQWLYHAAKPANLEILVVDPDGAPVPGVQVSVDVQHESVKASRVKGPGNAYLTQNVLEWVSQKTLSVTSEAKPAVLSFVPDKPGYYRFIASIKDTKGRVHETNLEGWAIGSGRVMWAMSDNARLEIIPEQNQYKIGDTARYLVKNPYPGARALVSVERYGVIKSWEETLSSSTPVIEVPIEADFLPGFYLSVLVTSPRVDKPISPEKVDLGKPAYRMGYATTRVVDPLKQIRVDISTDKKVYKPGETVTASIKAGFHPGLEKKPIEFAVAVVDEAVLDLNRSKEKYYDPYEGFNKLDALDVANYNLISRLLGRQKFEKKGADPGGDGVSRASVAELRSLFKYVAYWNPGLTPDDDGTAKISFTMPDNLTGWRIFVLAVTPDDRMGMGNANFKVNRPTEVRPVMPNQVVEGDLFKAGFSIMNRTEKTREIVFEAKVQGPLAKDSAASIKDRIHLPPYERREVFFSVQTKGHGNLEFTATAKDATDADGLLHKLPVNKRRSLETAATYGTTIKDEATVSVAVPKDIYTDVGDIGVVLSPTVIGNIDGAFKYLKDYPYLCWEQRLTKAVAAAHYISLKEYLTGKTEWADPEKVVTGTLASAGRFQAPNGGMTYWIASDQYVCPYLSAYTALAFGWLRQNGYEVPQQVEANLHEYLSTLLRQEVFPSFFTKGMASSVRAVALAALAEAGKTKSEDILRYAPHLPEMDLFGKAHFLMAAVKTEDVPKEIVAKTVDRILGHASQTGGKFQFNEPWDDSYKYLLATPVRSNGAVLSALLAAGPTFKGIGDIPFKMVRAITQTRGNRNHWENTQENIFCMNALVDYSRVYENQSSDMVVKAFFEGKSFGQTRFKQKTDPAVTFKRPLADDDPGKRADLRLTREGRGRLYYSARIAYDLKIDNAAPINSGIEIRREYAVEREGKFVLLKSPMEIRRGDIVRVDLFVSVPTARHFVVVDDPVPGGLEPVNTDLATASGVDAEKGKFKAADNSFWFSFSDWKYYGSFFWSFYHKELRHSAARFYADYLPAGNYHLSYTAQAVAEGSFSVMPVHAEEMYDPDVYGKGLPARLEVKSSASEKEGEEK